MDNQIQDPYWEYKDKVNYDYIFKANMPIFLEWDKEDGPLSDDQEIEICENIEKGITELTRDEDYNKECFEELGVGRVYPGVNEVNPKNIEMYFGISLLQQEEKVTVEDLIADIKEYMYVLDSNTDYESSVTGVSKTYIMTGETEEVEPKIISFHGSKPENVKVEIIKQPTTITENFDKVIVNEGSLVFKTECSNKTFKLTDEGLIEAYENNKLKDTQPFSRKVINEYCEGLLKEGYNLVEEYIPQEQIDKTKEELESDIEQVEELQTLKDELEDKVAQLEEDNGIGNDEFISTDKTSKDLNYEELKNINLDEVLNDSQKAWIEDHICTLKEFEQALKEFAEMIKMENDYSITISIDDYILQLFRNLNLEWR